MTQIDHLPIRDMFNELVPDYDRFNRISSLGFDVQWRKEIARTIKGREYILDVGTGTGDVALEIANNGSQVVGIDFSESMIKAARLKLKGNSKVSFEVARADQLPFEPNKFDGVTSAFVIRNLYHGKIFEASLREFQRVLKKDGLMVHLELTRPPRGILSWGHKVYIKSILPYIGKMVFGTKWPERYLEQTIEQFPEPKELCQRIRWAGFSNVSHYPLHGGIASLFCAIKNYQ